MTRRLTLDACREVASRHGGECLSDAYKNRYSIMRWRCADGHEWSGPAYRVLTGGWCRTCFRTKVAGKHLVLPDALEQAREIARKKGGECLSETYVRGTDRLRWRCANGHEWKATLTDIRRRTWCPICLPWNRERLCRSILEEMYQSPFPKARPKWLLSSRGTRLELDGYNEGLGLAFEHQGAHHYTKVGHFHRAHGELSRIRRDDARKKRLCSKHSVVLIRVPYTVPIQDLGEWLHAELLKADAKPPLVDGREVEARDRTGDTSLLELHAIARERGGACLSTTFMGVTVKHRFRCEFGHEWETTPVILKKGSWCFHCKPIAISRANMDPNGLERLRGLAAGRGGELLSPAYLGVNKRHEWRCAEGHAWFAVPTDVTKGSWCPTCWANRPKSKRNAPVSRRPRRGTPRPLRPAASPSP